MTRWAGYCPPITPWRSWVVTPRQLTMQKNSSCTLGNWATRRICFDISWQLGFIQLHSLQGLPPTQTRFPIPQGLCQNFPATFLASSGAKLQTGDASKVPKKKGWFLSLKVLTKRLHLNRVLSNCTWNWFNLGWCNPGYFLSLRANVHHVNRSSASVNHPSMPLRAPNIQMSTDLREQKDPFWCCQPSWSPEAMFQKDSQKVYDFFRKSDLTWLQFTPVCCFEIYLR